MTRPTDVTPVHYRTQPDGAYAFDAPHTGRTFLIRRDEFGWSASVLESTDLERDVDGVYGHQTRRDATDAALRQDRADALANPTRQAAHAALTRQEANPVTDFQTDHRPVQPVNLVADGDDDACQDDLFRGEYDGWPICPTCARERGLIADEPPDGWDGDPTAWTADGDPAEPPAATRGRYGDLDSAIAHGVDRIATDTLALVAADPRASAATRREAAAVLADRDWAEATLPADAAEERLRQIAAGAPTAADVAEQAIRHTRSAGHETWQRGPAWTCADPLCDAFEPVAYGALSGGDPDVRRPHVPAQAGQHTIGGLPIGPTNPGQYGRTHDSDCQGPGCRDVPFTLSPRSETYWSS
jgi:hypothetical protein